jgi:hypothetical protein
VSTWLSTAIWYIPDTNRTLYQRRPWTSFWPWSKYRSNPSLRSGTEELALAEYNPGYSYSVRNFKNRWVPSAIAGDTLAQSSLRACSLINKGRSLFLMPNIPCLPRDQLVFVSNQKQVPYAEFVLKATDNQHYRIHPVHQAGDKVVATSANERTIGYCFLIHRASIDLQKLNGKYPAQGALLRIMKKSGQSLVTIFECPLQITLTTCDNDLEVVVAKQLDSWSLSVSILYGKSICHSYLPSPNIGSTYLGYYY